MVEPRVLDIDFLDSHSTDVMGGKSGEKDEKSHG